MTSNQGMRKMTLLHIPLLFISACASHVSPDNSLLRHEYAHCNGWKHYEGAGPIPPPYQYDHKPQNFSVHVVERKYIPFLCGGTDKTLGCAYYNQGPICDIYVIM